MLCTSIFDAIIPVRNAIRQILDADVSRVVLSVKNSVFVQAIVDTVFQDVLVLKNAIQVFVLASNLRGNVIQISVVNAMLAS